MTIRRATSPAVPPRSAPAAPTSGVEPTPTALQLGTVSAVRRVAGGLEVVVNLRNDAAIVTIAADTIRIASQKNGARAPTFGLGGASWPFSSPAEAPSRPKAMSAAQRLALAGKLSDLVRVVDFPAYQSLKPLEADLTSAITRLRAS